MNQFEDMQIFCQVVESGGMSTAAAALHISTAKVSIHLARLEALLNVRLVDRSSRNVRVTADGTTYYEHCRKIVSEVIAMNDRLAGGSKVPTGLLRVEIASMLTNQLLLPVLHQFFREYPGITLELIHTNHLLDLGHGTCDLMIRAGPVDDSSLIGMPIGVAKSVVAASPDYIARHGEPRSIEELLQHNCLQFVDPNTGRITEWLFQKGDNRLEIRTKGNLILNEGQVKLEAALQGYGIYYGLEFPILNYIESGRLRVIMQDFQCHEERPLLIAYPRADFQSAKLKAFVDFLKGAYPSNISIQVRAGT